MASGNTLLYFTAQHGIPPTSTYAQQDVITGASNPVESIPVLAFDQTTVEYMDFRGKMPQNYSGGGLTIVICSSAGSTTGTLQWALAFRSFEDDAEDLDTTVHTYDYNTVNIGTLASAVGEVTYDNITFSDGADMDNVNAGDEFILRLRRDTGSDSLAADAYLHGIEVRET